MNECSCWETFYLGVNARASKLNIINARNRLERISAHSVLDFRGGRDVCSELKEKSINESKTIQV
jgi:hypothetical protein